LPFSAIGRGNGGMSSFRLHLFGVPRLERDGALIPITRRKGFALLAYVTLAAQPQSREALATLFWPDFDQSRAHSNLRRELSRLKSDLGADLLEADRQLVAPVAGSALWIDVAEFRRHFELVARHAGHFPAVACAECRAALEAAAALHTARFMAGFNLPDAPGFDEWQFFEAETLSRAYADGLERLLRWHQEAGELEPAIDCARRWLALDTLHEPAHRELMGLYARAGQQAAALRQYEECARLLGEELGIAPQAETTALYEAIRTRRFATGGLPSGGLPSGEPTEQAAQPAAGAMPGQAAPAALPVVPVPPAPPAPVAPAAPAAALQLRQAIYFCRAPDGVQIAYATVGDGPPLVKAANWLSHLEYDWRSPVWHHWLAGLSQRHRLIRYDERGCGLSDWDVADMSFEAWLSDLETVVAAAGLERFPLLGLSQGAAIAIAYAHRHPERVSHLILYGGYARGKAHRGAPAETLQEEQVLMDLIRIGWGREHPGFRQVFTSLFLPDGTPAQFAAFNELQRVSSTPENAARTVAGFRDINVSDLAAQLRLPTLVLHARGDLRIPFEEGRLLASLIPGARFVPLESRNHVLLEHEPAWTQLLAEVHGFLETPGISAQGTS
jgi:DNA-binding SARP family transcriptional activator/pimeloyl-ACP methyl ester carboxylesterase